MTQDDDFVKEFLVESREGLDNLDRDLVALEENPDDVARCDSAFRALHTIKGNSGFLDFPRLGELAHAGETVLQKIRDAEVTLNQSITDTLLELIDAIHVILNAIESDGTEGAERFENLEGNLALLAEGKEIEPAPPAESGTNLPAKSLTRLSSERQREDTSIDAQDTSSRKALESKGKPSRDAAGSAVDSATDADVDKSQAGAGDVPPTDDGATVAYQSGSKTSEIRRASDSSTESPVEENSQPDDSKPVSDAKPAADSKPTPDTQSPDVKPDLPKDDFGTETSEKPKRSPRPKKAAGKGKSAKKDEPGKKTDKKTTPKKSLGKETRPTKKTASPPDTSDEPDSKQSDSSQASAPSKTSDVSPDAGVASGLVRVDVELLDRLMNLVGELVLARNQIVEISKERPDSVMTNPIQRLNALTSELQDGVLKTRMQQIGSIWQRYPRMVRDFSRSSGKEINLQLSGRETELDKSLVEAIKDPLIHLIRNAIDHGIEKPYLRKIKGKPREGLITLKASHESGQVHIEISDDGAGLDFELIRKKAVQRGLISSDQAEKMGESDLRDSIFMPGFSTAEQVSNISGRGVGMDVVKTHVEKVGGTIEIDTERDVGTTFRLTVPLTLAIIPALIVWSNNQRFAIAQTNVVEMLSLHAESHLGIEFFHNVPVLRLRGDVLPVVALAAQLGSASEAAALEAATNIMVLKTGTRQFALIVDKIGNAEEIVVKPFGTILEGMTEYGGATIMGDGSVALILDVRGIAQRSGLFATDRSLLHGAEEAIPGADRMLAEASLLVVETRERQRIGLPLQGVIRLEELSIDQVELSQGREVVQYRGEILPVIDLQRVFDPTALVLRGQDSNEHISVVIYNFSPELHIGLVVQRIIDIAETPEQLRPTQNPGVIVGTTVALGKITDVISVASLAEQAGIAELVTVDD
jgi:two-component system chemotaxis sensor kinase CheA